MQYVRIIVRREDFGVRWQPAEAKRSEVCSAAATPLFDCGPSFQSGVALRFPPQSKKIWLRLRRAVPFAPFGGNEFFTRVSDASHRHRGNRHPNRRGNNRRDSRRRIRMKMTPADNTIRCNTDSNRRPDNNCCNTDTSGCRE